MKKALAAIMAFCLLTGWSAAVLVDDFNGYSTGAVETVTTNWKIFAGQPTGSVNIVTDPTNPSNKVLSITENGYGSGGGGYGILSGSAIIANGETKTLFYRFRTNASSATALNTCLGLTDAAVPIVNGWGTQYTQHRFNLGTTQARTATAWDPVPGVAVVADTWYNVWVQVNHAANTYKIYMNSTPGANGNATTDRIGIITPGDAFRVNGTGNLVSLSFYSIPQTTVATILLDDINIVSGESLINQSMPLGAHTPAPTDGETNVLTSTATLSWATGVDPSNPANPNPNITKHYVYMREGDPNLVGHLKATIPAGSPVDATKSCAMPLTLARDKTYYWRVDESVNNSSTTDPNTIQGAAWSFATQKSIPVITTQPVSVRVSTQTTASFQTIFTSVSPPTVVWKKNGSPISTGVVTTGPVGVELTYTTTLTFATTSDSDQADYSCELSVFGQTTPTTSNMVNLVTKKLLAHYAFEDNLNDSSSYGPHNGTAKLVLDPNITGTMAYDTGVIPETKAAKFDGTVIVDLGTGAYPKGSFTGTTLIGTGVGLGAGMDEATISCWVKATQIGGLITNYNDNILATTPPVTVPPTPAQAAANTTGFSMALAGTSDARAHLRGETATLMGTAPYQATIIAESFVGAVQGAPATPVTIPPTPAFNMIGDGLWHHVAVTWQQGGSMVAYIDGVQVATATAAAGTRDIFKPWQRGVVIGGIRTIADRAVIGELYKGLMDDLQVYNYAKTAHEIADIYNAVTGKGVCTETYASTYDYDKNCVVDLADFTTLAANWLDCGLYPTTTCP